MGIHLWRKHSYVKVEDDQPGCIWTVFRMINHHHPWHNVKKIPKMLPYYKKHHKPHDKSSNSKELKPEEEQHEISKTLEFDDDSTSKYPPSVDSGSSRGGSNSKRSIKARIKALMKEKDSPKKSDVCKGEQNNLLGNEENFGYDASAPTLMSLIKANPKLVRSLSRVDDSRSVKHKDSKKQGEFLGVLELFNVDQDMFLNILDEVSPRKPKKPRLVKSGTFPNPKLPSKIEHKHNEKWPVTISNERELRKVRSQGTIGRSLSLTDSLERHGYLFDSSSNKAIKKHLSKSCRLSNEKDFLSPDGLQGRRSFTDRLYLPESESYPFTSGEPLDEKSNGELKGSWVDSPRVSESLTKPQSDELRQNLEKHNDITTISSNCETNDWLTSVSVQEDEIDIIEWPIQEESISDLNNSMDLSDQMLADHYNNEDLQYVKFVLDVIGFAMGESQHKDWHNENQPLDPALFDGIEVCCPFEPKTSNKDIVTYMSSSHRKLLFDLLNDALIDIYENSYANYYPKVLSYWCHVCPKKKSENRDFEEVWEFVREYLSWRPELDPTHDVAMAHDLSKDKNGWVNLQLESESLGLELEDLIFNELLDEIVSY